MGEFVFYSIFFLSESEFFFFQKKSFFSNLLSKVCLMFLSLFPMIHFIVSRILSILKTKTKNIELFLYSPILERGFYVHP